MWQITLFKKNLGAGSIRRVKNGMKGALEVLGDERTD
jgi:hypothetical protein